MKTITVEELVKIANEKSVYAAIEEAKSCYGAMSERPKKPVLMINHTSKEVEDYAKAFKLYGQAKEVFDINLKNYQEHYNKINNIIIDFIKEYSGLYTIPKQYQDKVFSNAYEDGHSDGYTEVYNKLVNLIDIFN